MLAGLHEDLRKENESRRLNTASSLLLFEQKESQIQAVKNFLASTKTSTNASSAYIKPSRHDDDDDAIVLTDDCDSDSGFINSNINKKDEENDLKLTNKIDSMTKMFISRPSQIVVENQPNKEIQKDLSEDSKSENNQTDANFEENLSSSVLGLNSLPVRRTVMTRSLSAKSQQILEPNKLLKELNTIKDNSTEIQKPRERVLRTRNPPTSSKSNQTEPSTDKNKITSYLKRCSSSKEQTIQNSNSSNNPTQNTKQFAGLRNLGSTCYMNCIIQVIRFTPGFVESIKSIQKQIESLKKIVN
jgi:hypothetical protein